MILRFTLPLPHNRGNERPNWRKEKRLKDEYYLRCLADYGKMPDHTFQRARLTIRLYTWNLMDEDNLNARCKFPVDFLVKRGYIEDDSPAVLEWERPKNYINRRNQRVEIELEEITE